MQEDVNLKNLVEVVLVLEDKKVIDEINYIKINEPK